MGELLSFPGPNDPRRNKSTEERAVPAQIKKFPLKPDAPLRDPREDLAESVQASLAGEARDVFVAHHAQMLKAAHFISNLSGYVYDETEVAGQRTLIKDVQLEQLGEILGNTGETQWQERPAYYRAVLEELRDRLNLEDLF